MNDRALIRAARDAAVPPLVLLHGFMGAPASWSGVVGALEHGGPVHAPLLPGHGRPPRPLPRDFADAVDRLIAGLPRQFYLVGYSLGGRLGMAIACNYPERCLGLVAVGAHPGMRTRSERTVRVRWEDERARVLQARGLPAFVDAWEAMPLFASQAALSNEVRGAQRRIRESHDAGALSQVLRVLGTGRMPELDLEHSCVPIVAVTGQRDPHAAAVAQFAKLRGVRHVTLKGVGHNPLLEAPGPLARLIDECCGVSSEVRTLENHP